MPPQRPSWNYRKEDGGGIIIDMLCHFRYVLDNLFGEVQAVSCLGATHIGKRWDENGKPYNSTADDAAYATFELAGGIDRPYQRQLVRPRAPRRSVGAASRWHQRQRRRRPAPLLDPVLCRHAAPDWNPDVDSPIDFYDGWQQIPAHQTYENAFKIEWELFLRHVVRDEPFRWTLLEGAKGVQLAEAGHESWKQRKWVTIPSLEG